MGFGKVLPPVVHLGQLNPIEFLKHLSTFVPLQALFTELVVRKGTFLIYIKMCLILD